MLCYWPYHQFPSTSKGEGMCDRKWGTTGAEELENHPRILCNWKCFSIRLRWSSDLEFKKQNGCSHVLAMKVLESGPFPWSLQRVYVTGNMQCNHFIHCTVYCSGSSFLFLIASQLVLTIKTGLAMCKTSSISLTLFFVVRSSLHPCLFSWCGFPTCSDWNPDKKRPFLFYLLYSFPFSWRTGAGSGSRSGAPFSKEADADIESNDCHGFLRILFSSPTTFPDYQGKDYGSSGCLKPLVQTCFYSLSCFRGIWLLQKINYHVIVRCLHVSLPMTD